MTTTRNAVIATAMAAALASVAFIPPAAAGGSVS